MQAPERRVTTWTALSVAAIALLVHLPDLGGGFMADDHALLQGVTADGQASLRHTSGYFIQPLPGIDPPLPAEVDPRFWRPAWMASLGLDFHLFGARPFGFLLVNVLLHVAVSVLLLLVAPRLRVGLLAAAAGAVAVLASGVLYQAHARDRAGALELSRPLIESASERIARSPADRWVFTDVPPRYRGAPTGMNIFPFALMPPFAERSPPGEVQVVLAGQADMATLRVLQLRLQRGERVEVYSWDRPARAFRRLRQRR